MPCALDLASNAEQMGGGMISRYWGKADLKYTGEPKWHPLAYHCLDVAAVAASWWDSSHALRDKFRFAFVCSVDDLPRLRAWVLFFVALHDLGKFDLRFQLKASDAMASAWRRLEKGLDHDIPLNEITGFDHGHAGMAWAFLEVAIWLNQNNVASAWEKWENWLSAVTGHHGDYHPARMAGLKGIEADESLIEQDCSARHAFVAQLEKLFLQPAGLSFQELPPFCALPARALLAGFCSSSDWLGSNAEVFEYRAPGERHDDYFDARCKQIKNAKTLEHFGLIAVPLGYAGVQALLGEHEAPRGVQTEIDALPAIPSLTLIEAPTGSGKTEAALAYAWRLLDAGMADSIVFALPTQATANAMLERIEAFAARTFGVANVVLAHGKRQFNEGFQQLVERGQHVTSQGEEEAGVQCAAWLASSRKRVFLGQIGVCTVDQVLLAVLPVRHKFVRGFGLAKSVLIVDEVHAYDAYMYGLLGEVLKNQQACGGSAILLSATLPANQRRKLLETWASTGPDEAPYPALWHATGGETLPKTVTEAQRPPRREVGIECLRLAEAFPDEALLERIVTAAEDGALVGIVLNLVDNAQRLARLLRQRTTIEVDVFHARYRFADRQSKEAAVLKHYGRDAARSTGRILVATQVVEQSLDLDFDWMLTQICPVDLLFQRIGRLHRHVRERRPPGFESPRCTVLSVDGDDYGVFELIYGNARVLWRTETLLARSDKLVFPEAYRDWIEQVYQREDWDDEPEKVAVDFDAYSALQIARMKDAQRLTTMTVSSFRDDDDRISGLTRDGEMSLSVLPITADGCLLDKQRIADVPEWELAEALNLAATPAPASWKNSLRDCRMEKDGPLAGYLQLVMSIEPDGGWQSSNGQFTYSQDFGLEKRRNEPA
jgi:CRISPR-associated endonuclease/helicase Cas3